VRYWRGGIELYDHSVDPYEHVNLAPGGKRKWLPAEYTAVVEALEANIPAEWAAPVDRVKSAAGPEDADAEDVDEEDAVPESSGSGPIPHWARMVD
jgi:hypothetical protein